MTLCCDFNESKKEICHEVAWPNDKKIQGKEVYSFIMSSIFF